MPPKFASSNQLGVPASTTWRRRRCRWHLAYLGDRRAGCGRLALGLFLGPAGGLSEEIRKDAREIPHLREVHVRHAFPVAHPEALEIPFGQELLECSVVQ